MRVEVQLFATLAAFRPLTTKTTGTTLLDLPEGSTVNDVAEALGVPHELPRVALVNGQDASPERPLSPDDVVTFFPPLAGGG